MAQKAVRKLVAFEWVSLDGVFDADTFETWFNPFESPERGQIIKQQIDGADGFVLGRVTFEMLAPYWSKLTQNEMGVADRLNGQPKYVVSTKLERANWQHSTIIRDDAVAEIHRLKAQPGQDLLIFGSARLVQSLAVLIDEYRFLVHPAIAGTGKRFFADGAGTQKLRLLGSQSLPTGVLFLRYASDGAVKK